MFANGPGDPGSILGHVNATLLTLSIIRYESRIKWSNPGKEEALFPTPWCSSYLKGSLQVTLDYSHPQHYKVRIKDKVEQSRKRRSTLPNTLV